MLGACAVLSRRGPIGNKAVPEPTKAVELYRYMGRWYAQFRYVASFERDMDEVTADYSFEENGRARVVNRGRRGRETGRWKENTGLAKVVDAATHAKLKVSFFDPFYGDYWVVAPSSEMLQDLAGRLKALGYDWSLVRKTQQRSADLEVMVTEAKR